MKKAIALYKTSKALFFIKLYVVCGLAMYLIFLFNDFYDMLVVRRWYEFPMEYKLETLGKLAFRVSAILLLSIGVFKMNRKGWIILASFFYFLLYSFLFNLSQDFSFVMEAFLGALLVIVLCLVPLVILNFKNIISTIYGISSNNKVPSNIIATCIGLVLVVLFGLIKSYNY